MPISVETEAPLHPVVGSAGPVIVKPLRFSEMSDAPNAMHGAPVTVHVTLPTSREFSESISVLTITPLMSRASAAPDASNSAPPTTPASANRLPAAMTHLSLLSSDLHFSTPTNRDRWCLASRDVHFWRPGCGLYTPAHVRLHANFSRRALRVEAAISVLLSGGPLGSTAP